MKKIKLTAVIFVLSIAVLSICACGRGRETEAVEQERYEPQIIEQQNDTEEIILVRENLPARTLRVLTDNRHTGVFLQAAQAMKNDWYLQNKPYNFEMEMESIRFLDSESVLNRETRLQTEIMAGQGPDIFTINTFLGAVPIHAMTDRGFLHNVYTLIDSCPRTNLSDFFKEALKAYELNGHLYMFPTSFGFSYIGINASLPQEFIERFAQKTTVNILEMMNFYSDLMDMHSSEFAHLTFNTGDMLSTPNNIFSTQLGEFVDFNARISDITNPRFVEFLNYVNEFFDENIFNAPPFFEIRTRDCIRERAGQHVFLSQSQGLINFDAFSTAETPFFPSHSPCR